jgi:hypothetical protein
LGDEESLRRGLVEVEWIPQLGERSVDDVERQLRFVLREGPVPDQLEQTQCRSDSDCGDRCALSKSQDSARVTRFGLLRPDVTRTGSGRTRAFVPDVVYCYGMPYAEAALVDNDGVIGARANGPRLTVAG